MTRLEVTVEERKDGAVCVFVSRPRGGTARERRAAAALVEAALAASLPPAPKDCWDPDESELERALRVARQTTG